MESRAFIVAAWEESRSSATSADGRIFVTGRQENGRSFAALIPAANPALYVARDDGPRALESLQHGLRNPAEVQLDPQAWSDLAGAPLSRLILPRGALGQSERLLGMATIPLAARDYPHAANTLAQLGLAGPVLLRGEPQPGRRVDDVFVDPELIPEAQTIALSWMALDIETDRDGCVTAVSLAGKGGPGEVLFLGPPPGAAFVTSFETEAALLTALATRIVERDPDVITGWNVIDFDLDVLFHRFTQYKIPFLIGRTAEVPALMRNGTTLRVPGRAVLDGVRLVRSSGERFEDLSLEAVAQSVLGAGKTVTAHGEAKLKELERLRREEPLEFCNYNLRDSELVLSILAKTGLDLLTARRAALTGVPLELAWTSIPAFERIYASELRARRILPPEKPEHNDVSGAAGGTVLDAFPGMFKNVWVFDFRSLYPSIMRTFNIDPLSHARAESRAPPLDANDEITAPNGARFERAKGILPEIIARYAAEREQALKAGDETAAYVYKILQNSFYGVLGAEGCRYARTELASAITSFGKKFLTAARDFFEERGSKVLYGDTDSVFVLSALGDDASYSDLMAWGNQAALELNARISASIEKDYKVSSFLRIRCDKVYRRFFIPRIKSDASGNGRGRAKGYAGLRLGEAGAAELEVRGMEAVRSDFTPLARRFQLELLALAFADSNENVLRNYCRELVARLKRGELDEELVYRKSLRRSAEEYGSETPQVKAARMLGWTEQRGRISYVMTRDGAEPIEARSRAALDHQHYIEHQLDPIARSTAEGLGFDGREWLEPQAQLELAFA